MKQQIGVVLAAYNGEKYIAEQLNSIINQTCRPDYIVVSDGGSKDNTVSICYSILDTCGIQYCVLTSDKQLSVKENFEKGYIVCPTKYVFFADQDDKWLQDKIKSAMDVFRRENPVMVFCNAYVVDEKLTLSGKTLWNSIGYHVDCTQKIYQREDLELIAELLKHNIATGMCMAVDKEELKTVLPFSEHGIHDVWCVHIANLEGKVVALNECDVLYRQHQNNAIGTGTDIKKTYAHGYRYNDNLVKRYNFIADVRNGMRTGNSDVLNIYSEYHQHLADRIGIIAKKKPLWMIVRKYKDYRRFEYKFYQIMIKDFLAREFFERVN